MFGQNPIRPLVRDPQTLAVEEIFYTIQGEGPYGGLPALFIRLAGCNLACWFCDTQFETQVMNIRSANEVMLQVLAFPREQRKFVVLTGGEPMRQNPARLIAELFASGTELVQIETAGTVWQEDLSDWIALGRVVLVCSPKTPKVHPSIALACNHWKYITRAGDIDPDDGLPNRGTQTANRDKIQRLYRPSSRPGQQIWLSPCDEYDDVLNQVNRYLARDLCMQYGYRLSLQMHKIIDAR